MKTKNIAVTTLLLSHLVCGIGAMWWCRQPAAAAQEEKKEEKQEAKKLTFLPDGFEFPINTPTLAYHFIRSKYKGVTFEGRWIAEKADEIEPDYVIDKIEIKPGALPVIKFSLNKPKDQEWPRGLYRLEVREDKVLRHTVRFIIQ